jgi:hypothetical protein
VQGFGVYFCPISLCDLRQILSPLWASVSPIYKVAGKVSKVLSLYNVFYMINETPAPPVPCLLICFCLLPSTGVFVLVTAVFLALGPII